MIFFVNTDGEKKVKNSSKTTMYNKQFFSFPFFLFLVYTLEFCSGLPWCHIECVVVVCIMLGFRHTSGDTGSLKEEYPLWYTQECDTMYFTCIT